LTVKNAPFFSELEATADFPELIGLRSIRLI